MTARDELVELLAAPRMHANGSLDKHRATGDAVIAAGWRKMPSKEQIEAHLEEMEFHWSQPWKGDVLDAILALMDGDNE